jgi:hypothetical protein
MFTVEIRNAIHAALFKIFDRVKLLPSSKKLRAAEIFIDDVCFVRIKDRHCSILDGDVLKVLFLSAHRMIELEDTLFYISGFLPLPWNHYDGWSKQLREYSFNK